MKSYGVNLYAALGVSRDANKEAIKQAYYILAKKWHPDMITNESEKKVIEDKFKEITYAYDILSDDDARSKYDRESDGSVNVQESTRSGSKQPFTFYKNSAHASAALQAQQFAHFTEMKRKKIENSFAYMSKQNEGPTSYFEAEHLLYDQFKTPEKYHEEIIKYNSELGMKKRQIFQTMSLATFSVLSLFICLSFILYLGNGKHRWLEEQIKQTYMNSQDMITPRTRLDNGLKRL